MNKADFDKVNIMGSARVTWMFNTIADNLQIPSQTVEDQLNQETNKKLIEQFIKGEGSQKIFVYYQVQDQQQSDDNNIKDTGNQEQSLFVTFGDSEKLKDKAIWFLRNFTEQTLKKGAKYIDDGNDENIIFGEINQNTIPILNHLMENVYHPFIHSLKDDWGVCDEESKKEYLTNTDKFQMEVGEAIKLMNPNQDSFRIEQQEADKLNQLTSDSEKIQEYEKYFKLWMEKISNQLNDDTDQRKDPPDAGPKTELVYWRNRMQKITNWSEQLKSKDFQNVKSQLNKLKTHESQNKRGDESIQKLMNDYSRLDLLLTDKLNEAKDNVKYLQTLEKFIEPLYKNDPQQISDTLPALMNAIKMIHTIARFYNTVDKMTTLFQKITNQMIINCKERILNTKENQGRQMSQSDKIKELWKRDPAEIIEILGSCIKLYKDYRQCYNETKDKQADMPKGKTFEFSETAIFGKFESFVRRLQKLIEIFSNIQQFKSLQKHNLEGMDKLTSKFNEIIEQFKKKGHDLLDTQNKFDRDHVEFNVEISKLDLELQRFIDDNFTQYKNIEYSLKLLNKFEKTIKRDSLRHNLTSKYNAILTNYAAELDSISRAFQEQKGSPPIVRNMPPEAGKIIWSRHLLQKITGSILLFPENQMNQTDLKKYFGAYNTLGKQLTIYEMWYFQNWVGEIERSKAALQATLIVRSDQETNKKLYVNFDLEIMQLIREAKCLDRQGIAIPESARIILLQEEKFKMYYNELLYALKEYERIISKIKPICTQLLEPHIGDLELKLRPGMVTLTWTSMNIDSYLFHVHQGLKKLEQLIINVNDIIENRIDNNLKNVCKVVLVHLPQDTKPMSLDNFVSQQEEYINTQTNHLISKNIEVERAVDDLLATIVQYPLDPHAGKVQQQDTQKIKRYYSWYFYQALLNATQHSLNAMKYRVCGKKGAGSSNSLQNLKPFFEVDVQLQSDNNKQSVELNPSLDQIQKSINKAATAVLKCSKNLYTWDQNQSENENEKKSTFYDQIARDKEIVKVILLLTGSIQGTRNKVKEFLSNFTKYDWLYTKNISDEIKIFKKKNPTLQDYEDELKKFSQFEEEIDKFVEAYKIGAMKLKTENIINGLKWWAKEWKQQYSQDLHKKARQRLDTLTEQTKNLQTRLSRDVIDINSLGQVMETLEEIRKIQAEIDMKFNPVLEMYALLDNYLVGGITDKDEMDARSMLKRNWDELIKQAEQKDKDLQQKQTFHLKELKSNIKNFIKEVADFRKEYEKNGPIVEGISPQEAMERLRNFERLYENNYSFYKINRRGEELFGLKKQTYPELEKTDAEIRNLKKLYDLYDTVIKNLANFREKSWAEITKEEMLNFQDDAAKYGEQCSKLPKDLKEWAAYKDLKKQIEDLKEVLPLITDLKKPSIMDRHWQQICEITKKKLNYQNPDLMTIDDLISANLLHVQEDIIDITESADKQLKIRQKLDDIEEFWNQATFDFVTWGKRDVQCMLAGIKVQEIMEKLEEDSTELATISAQRQVAPFKAEVEQKIKTFSDVTETLDMWVKVQKLWSSLEPVFMGGDIARQMPLQAKSFQGIDKNWLKIMEKAVETKKVVPCCQNDLLKDLGPDLNLKLEQCQKSLEEYLEGKRKNFSRFYFVSDPTLLKILSQGSEPTSIQEDFEKLFDAITKCTFDKNPEKKGSTEKIITAISQQLGKDFETIQLTYIVKCIDNIETWLGVLEKNMQKSLKDIAKNASTQVMNIGLRDFCKSQPAQIALMGIQILWTSKMTEGLEGLSRNVKNAMDLKRKEVKEMMDVLSAMCLEQLTKVERVKVETLVTIQVHQKDITFNNELKFKDVNDFEWQKQCRLYWNQEVDNCIVSITDWDQSYSYEYLGAKERLCITPLTDRCYITLAQAMSMYYGGAPAGPAGTGKTETVKDLGRTLGVFVVVTNCSDQHRYRDMAKIFKGLVQSGLWGCFDEFNRIDLEVLSVVAMQVEAITTARKQHLTKFWFPEEIQQIDLVQSVGYFITMNPGYAGRQELPENLKVLFRGVTMMVPDREIIIKVKLASVGYKEIDPLSKKFNQLYRLCEEQLSKQKHYDFGLRNILSVLRTAGNTKREDLKSEEEMLLMRSLRDMNLSKLVADDIPLFTGLLLDIFPRQTNVPKRIYPDVEKKIPDIIKSKKGLVSTETFQLKIIQLYETCVVRHGFMLVGPTGSGKTTIMNILTEALSSMGTPHKIQRLNPKAIKSQEMYGVKSDISDDWIPGVFSTIWEKSNNRALKHNTWITCDGPVDAIWIENLNTVLDDNKILTLANGERIAMTENCKLVFEVENLNNASPATVSRCGQVYISASDLGYEAVLSGWIAFRKSEGRQEEAEKLDKILSKYFLTYRIMETTTKICKEPVIKLSEICKLTNTLNLLTGCLQHFVNQNKFLSEIEYEKFAVFAISWAIGGICEANDRMAFHEYLLQKSAPVPQKGKENETLFDYMISPEYCDWKLCQPEEWKPPQIFQFSQLLLPTLDSFRAELLLNFILQQPKSSLCDQASLLVGGSGTAKTSSVLMYAGKSVKQNNMLFKRINFSSATMPIMFQATIEAECETKVGKDFAPPENKEMIVFIDDMSMPFVNEWGDQITLEIVRQLVEQGGFYKLEKTERGNFKNIKNLKYIGAMNHPGGGRNDIPNRLKRHFFIFNMILPLDIEQIYGPIIKFVFKPQKNFQADAQKIIESLTKATISLWNKVKSTMLPTPSKFHYLFNMRELSRIFKGVLQVKKEVIQTASTVGNMKQDVFLVGLWRHECERVFVDKMVSNKDKDQVLGYISEISLDAYSHIETEIVEKFGADKIFLFCDFLREDVKNEEGIIEVYAEKVYEAINNIETLRKRCKYLLDEYNLKFVAKKMPLVLFDDALKHLLRISRIVQMNRSSALLVGVGGSGKQSLTRLAAEIGRQPCFQITISKTYGEKELKEDIKKCFDWAGHKGPAGSGGGAAIQGAVHTTFLLTDAEVKKEEFLEYINMILSTGEIPNLLAKDEREVWLGDLRNELQKKKLIGNVDPTPSELWGMFVDRVRDHLHVVLCFSPVGQKFRDRARKFPALFNECTIDWFLPWPEEALVSVAQTFIQQFKELDTKEETKQELMKHMGNVHIMVNEVCDVYFAKMRRQVYVTPKSFLSYLQMYKTLYLEKYTDLDKQEKKKAIGLNKIQEATHAIDHMKVGLKEEEKELKEASDKVEKLLASLDIEQKKAQQKQEEVENTTKNCKEQAEMIARDKESAEKDLAAALPALRAAQEAVDNLNPADIVEMKTNKNPKDIIKYIMDSVVIFFQGKLAPISIEEKVFNQKEGKIVQFMKDSYEEGGKPTLNDMKFMNNLKFFAKDEINEETYELLEPLLKSSEWFNLDAAIKVSKAAAGIMKWAVSIADYYQKSKIVKPKKIQLAIMEGKFAVATKELEKSQKELKECQEYVAKLRENFNTQIEAKNKLEQKAQKTKKKINTATTLINSLSGEKERWGKESQEIGEEKRRLVGNASLSCAFISYCGAFNAEFRQKLANDYFIADMKKKGVPVTPGLDLKSFLVNDATIGEWNLQGLPQDDLSIQNGIMVTNSSRFCLFIDPQTQGQKWIEKKFEESIDPTKSKVQLSHPKFRDTFLKFCMEEGKCLIIENIENEVDPMLDPVLERQIQTKGKNKFIDVGGQPIDYNAQFKLFLTCRLSNPAFSPELSAKVTIIDFTVTQSGLEQQLLGKVISKEQKALEDQLQHLLADVNQNKKDLQRLDANLLERLTNSQGNLLDDTELVDVLNSTKTQQKEVAAKLIDAEIKTKEINDKREQYRPVAVRGSALYFTMIEVAGVNWMYNSSLKQFLEIFLESIDKSEKDNLPSKRVQNIIAELTFNIYYYVNRGLFEKDKLTFILMMCFKILQTAQKISGNDVSMFLKSGAALDSKAERAKPFTWIKDDATWMNILALSRHTFGQEPIPFFRELPDSMQRNENLWKGWMDKNDPEAAIIPDFSDRIAAEKELGHFIHLVLVRSLRVDRTLVASTLFIQNVLGKKFTAPISYPIDHIWQESTNQVPILFLLSAGADPTSSIDELAKKKKKFPCDKVSMGEGQERAARQVMFKGFQEGTWVILQNCHLGLKFMLEIETTIVPDTPIHQDFRLWITCEQHPKFPLGLLQKTLKVTNEPPKGLKAGLNKTFTTIITQEFLDKVDHPNWRNLIFTLCFLHSIVIERRKFGPLGWCVPYEFNNSDLEASLFFVEKYLTNIMSTPQVTNSPNLPISMTVINYMVCEVQYGGRITDNMDREMFKHYGIDYLKDQVLSSEHTYFTIQSESQGGAKESFKYKIPANPIGEIQKYHDYIGTIPQIDSPEVFGLHNNADLTFRLKESVEMINTIMETRPKDSSSSGGKTREELVQELAKIQLNKLPQDYIDSDIREKVKKLPGPKNLPPDNKGLSIPLNIFLYQELQRMQNVVSIVRKTLIDINDAIDGQIIMTPDILNAINSISDAKVPSTWLYDPSGAEISWLLPTFGGWFNSLILRHQQLNDWMNQGRPQYYWLAGFFNPQGFLTAMKQEVTRMHKKPEKGGEAWSLDDVDYKTEVKEKEVDPNSKEFSEGVYIRDLFLEGCSWSKNGLDEPQPKIMFGKLPYLYVTATQKKKSSDTQGMNIYDCPVYKYPRRTDKYFIFDVKLPCEGTGPHKWKLRGVALLCSTE